MTMLGANGKVVRATLVPIEEIGMDMGSIMTSIGEMINAVVVHIVQETIIMKIDIRLPDRLHGAIHLQATLKHRLMSRNITPPEDALSARRKGRECFVPNLSKYSKQNAWAIVISTGS